MDVPLEMGIQSPQVLEACHCIESGYLVRIESPSRAFFIKREIEETMLKLPQEVST
jgi:hypothetical protein